MAEWVKVVLLPDLAEHGDVSDWLDAGHTVDELCKVVEKTGVASSFHLPPGLGSDDETQNGIVIIPSRDVPAPDEDTAMGLLDPLVPEPPALVPLSGESSAGKTVFSYNLAYHLAEGLPFVGLVPPRPLRVLYCDLDNPDAVNRMLVERIGRSDNLAFVRALPMTLDREDGRLAFLEACMSYRPDVLILDALPVLWPVRDENDNALADRQMIAIKQMTTSLGCATLCLWSMGESNNKDIFKTRGATARVDRADLVINYGSIDDNTRSVKIVKSRYGTLGTKMVLRFTGEMGIEATTAPTDAAGEALSRSEEFILDVERVARDVGVTTPAGFREALNPDEYVLDRALRALVARGVFYQPSRGRYVVTTSSTAAVLPPDDETAALHPPDLGSAAVREDE